MRMIFMSSCGEFVGRLKELSLARGNVWYLITEDQQAFRFIGNVALLSYCAHLNLSALVYGECVETPFGTKKFEVVDVKPVFDYELSCVSTSTL